MRKLFLLVVVAAAAMSAATRGASLDPVPQDAAAVGEAGSPPAAGPAADNPVSLADAQEFDAPAPEVGQAEIAEARRTLASAVSSEKFMDGATAVLVAYLIYLVAF